MSADHPGSRSTALKKGVNKGGLTNTYDCGEEKENTDIIFYCDISFTAPPPPGGELVASNSASTEGGPTSQVETKGRRYHHEANSAGRRGGGRLPSGQLGEYKGEGPTYHGGHFPGGIASRGDWTTTGTRMRAPGGRGRAVFAAARDFLPERSAGHLFLVVGSRHPSTSVRVF